MSAVKSIIGVCKSVRRGDEVKIVAGRLGRVVKVAGRNGSEMWYGGEEVGFIGGCGNKKAAGWDREHLAKFLGLMVGSFLQRRAFWMKDRQIRI
jgi:hypothetical protein